MMIFRSTRYSMVALSMILFGGCSLSEHKLSSNISMPSTYDTVLSDKINIHEKWWEEFGIDELNLLVSKALTNSPDILSALQKIEQSRLNLDIVEGSDLSVGLSANSTLSKEINTNGDTNPSVKNTTAGLNVGYEIDLLEKIFDPSTKKAKADFEATKYDVETAKISLVASVADNYMQWLNINKKIEIANENLKISQNLLNIVEVKYQNGVASLIDLNKQKSTLLSQESSLVSLEHQKKQLKNSLAILVGETPQSFELSYDNSVLDSVRIPEIGSGVPSELLLRRPDIASSLANLQSQEASILSAKLDRLPSLKLNLANTLEMTKTALFSLANPAVNSSVIGVSLAQSIFDGGKLKNQEQIAISKGEQAIQEYRKTVLNALQEVENTMSSLSQNDKQLTLQKAIYENTKHTLKLSELKYKEGILEHISLLDSQKSYFQADEQLVEQKFNYIASIIELHKVLGGGWKRD